MCGITHSYVWHDFACVMRLICMRDMTQEHLPHRPMQQEALLHWYSSVMSHIWMSRTTHTNESCHMYVWVMSHMWMSHASEHLPYGPCDRAHTMNVQPPCNLPLKSCHTYERIMSHIWMSHACTATTTIARKTTTHRGMYIYRYTYSHMNTYIHMYTYIHTHIYI